MPHCEFYIKEAANYCKTVLAAGPNALLQFKCGYIIYFIFYREEKLAEFV